MVEQISQEKEALVRQVQALRNELADTRAKLRSTSSQRGSLQNALSNLEQLAGACRDEIDKMKPTIVMDADVIRKTDNILVWRVTLDKAGPIFVELAEVSGDDIPIVRRRQPRAEWSKTHILSFTDLDDHTQYRLTVYTNMSGSTSSGTVIGDPKVIGDLTSETKSALPVGKLDFSPIEFKGRKALFKVTAKDTKVRAAFRCAKYIVSDKDKLPLEPQSLSEWIQRPPVVSEQDYLLSEGVVIEQGEPESFECPGDVEPNAFYQIQFDGYNEDSGRKLAPANTVAYQAPVAFDFDDREFVLSFDSENMTVTWGATLAPKKATLALLVDGTEAKETNLTQTVYPNSKTVSLSLGTLALLRNRITEKKIAEPLMFQISMEKDGEPEPLKRRFRVSYVIDGKGGLNEQQKESLQKALESFAKGETPTGRITWKEVVRLGIPVVMSFL